MSGLPRPCSICRPRRFGFHRRLPMLWSRRERLRPTIAGWILLAGLGLGAAAGGWFRGEDFLAVTDRPGTEILVVEGWIGNSGVKAAAEEFRTGGYRWAVATGGLTSDRWDTEQWSYAELARRDLLAAGVPGADIIVARPRETGRQRTFESALAVRRALSVRPTPPRFVTIFTLGAHARRSRAVFAKVFGPEVRVGSVAWRPSPDYQGPWWRSSDRTEDLVKESVGWLAETLVNSGRGFSPGPVSTH